MENTSLINSPFDASLIDGVVDLVHADPPWLYDHGIGVNGGAQDEYDGLNNESIVNHLNDCYKLAAKNAYMVVWCTWPRIVEFAASCGTLQWTHITGGAWHKNNGLGVGYHVRGDSEPILIYRKGKPKPQATVSNHWAAKRRGHSEKPQNALIDFLRLGCPVGGTVLDPYAGKSGSMARACESYGAKYIGFEPDPKRHAEALTRISQGDLFCKNK